MKIVQINAVSGNGSTGRICEELTDAAIKKGHEAIILYGNGKSEYRMSKKIATDMQVKTNALYARFSGLTAYGAALSTKKVVGMIEEYRPDIVHLHNLHGNYINLKVLLEYLADKDIPTVITLHDCWFFTGKCTHYTTQKCYKWQKGCQKCPKLKDDIPSWFFDRTSKMWKEKKEAFQSISRLGVIGVSDWILKEAQKSYLNTASLMCRIYNWVELDVFRPVNTDDIVSKYNLHDKVVVFCASAKWEKGSEKVKDLIRFAKKIDEDWVVLIAGNIEDGIVLPNNTILVGYIHDMAELASLYAVADVYVHFSREDTFGKVIAESMACGTPVVVYNSTACPELVEEGCGYVVDVGDADAIYDMTKRIKENGKEFYFDKCVEFVKKNFERSKLIDETIQFYEKIQI